MTSIELRARENAILDALERTRDDTTFLGKLYRDGVPSPDAYLAQRVRVLFVLREPNMRGAPHAHDMRVEVSDERFRPAGEDGREDRSVRGWWNNKVGMFADAVAAALADKPPGKAFDRFATMLDEGTWNHEVVNRFAYIQVKKIGGGGSSKAKEICAHAARYASTLRRQIELYRPHLIIGCGVGKDSPARLLATHVLPYGEEMVTTESGATWWRFRITARPQAMIQLYHPARRGSRSYLYRDVWSSVREVAKEIRVGNV